MSPVSYRFTLLPLILFAHLPVSPDPGLALMSIVSTTVGNYVTWGLGKLVGFGPFNPPPVQVSQTTVHNNGPIQNQHINTMPAPGQRSYLPDSLAAYRPGLLTTAAVYAAIQARLWYLVNFLTDKKRPSNLFSHLTLNELLLVPTENINEVLSVHLFDAHAITNQQTLKLGMVTFLQDIDHELSAIKEYERYCSVLEKIGAVHGYINQQIVWVLGATIPFVGPLISKIPLPTIDQFFYVHNEVKRHLQERTSKLLFLRTAFLQVPFSV